MEISGEYPLFIVDARRIHITSPIETEVYTHNHPSFCRLYVLIFRSDLTMEMYSAFKKRIIVLVPGYHINTEVT
jgi:hypothetical protein